LMPCLCAVLQILSQVVRCSGSRFSPRGQPQCERQVGWADVGGVGSRCDGWPVMLTVLIAGFVYPRLFNTALGEVPRIRPALFSQTTT